MPTAKGKARTSAIPESANDPVHIVRIPNFPDAGCQSQLKMLASRLEVNIGRQKTISRTSIASIAAGEIAPAVPSIHGIQVSD